MYLSPVSFPSRQVLFQLLLLPRAKALPLLQSTLGTSSLSSESPWRAPRWEAGASGSDTSFKPVSPSPTNHLHLSAAVLPEVTCLTSLRLKFLTCDLRLIRINSLEAYCEVWIPFASICVSALLTGFPILFISNTNDLTGHLTWLMPPSLNLPFPCSHGRCCLVFPSQFLSQQLFFSPDRQD